MKKILDLGFGRETLRDLCNSGQSSSRLLYGMAEISHRGNYIVIECSMSSHSGLKGLLKNNMMSLKKADIIFMSYIYESSLILICLLKALGLFKQKKIVGVCHTTVNQGRNLLDRIVKKLVFNSFDKVLFHSYVNMEESLSLKTINRSQAEFLYWGDDLSYVDKAFPIRSHGDFFVSTGRENRDYSLLINAFIDLPLKLEIYTNRFNFDNNYDYLDNYRSKFKNIDIFMVDRSNETTLHLLERVAACRCVLVPLIQSKVNYCLGLTSIVEAMALGKPIISSVNPYSPVDIEKEEIGFVVRNVVEWKSALQFISENPDEAEKMGMRARSLAEKKFNIEKCSQQIESVFSSL